MCGISALFLTLPDRSHAAFRRSLDLVKHRGPDGRGVVWGQGGERTVSGEHSDEAFSWALGHVRLAILDTSSGGAQPMSRDNGTYWITYNGEIYNYLELRKELESAGHRFVTGTDTEVILAAYAQWGTTCLHRFIGMFAFVLVDLARHRVFCARDRFGVKPLYFWQGASGTFVCSEPKQLKAFPAFTFRANRQQLVDFLVDDVVNHVPNESLFQNVIPLVPGYFLTWDLNDAFPDIHAPQCYWSLPEGTEPLTQAQAIESLREMLVDTVRLHLRSDVPVGTCLSGGIDSSSLVGIMSRDLATRTNTFSACFNGYRFDEQYYMDIVNRHCDAVSCKVFPSDEGCARELAEVVYHQDEPFGGPSIYSQWCVMRAAREQNVPVLLDGQGGDEALCGYRKYNFFYLRDLVHRGRYGRLLQHIAQMLLRGDRKVLRIQEGQRYLPSFLRRDGEGILDLLRPQFLGLFQNTWRLGNEQNRTLKDFQRDDLLRWSLPSLLRYEDRNSMAHGVESRVPYVDHRFMEFCLRLPTDLFFIGGRSKRALTMAMGDRLPPQVHARRDKLGFKSPGIEWLRGDLGRVMEHEVRTSGPLAEILDTQKVAAQFAALRCEKKTLGSEKLFAIASVAVWMRLFSVEP